MLKPTLITAATIAGRVALAAAIKFGFRRWWTEKKT